MKGSELLVRVVALLVLVGLGNSNGNSRAQVVNAKVMRSNTRRDGECVDNDVMWWCFVFQIIWLGIGDVNEGLLLFKKHRRSCCFQVVFIVLTDDVWEEHFLCETVCDCGDMSYCLVVSNRDESLGRKRGGREGSVWKSN